jgi:hypothetical protein
MSEALEGLIVSNGTRTSGRRFTADLHQQNAPGQEYGSGRREGMNQ